jgi:hypothetical protein
MTRGRVTAAVAALAAVTLTILGTRALLALLPDPAEHSLADAQTSFLAHLLFPLSVVLGLFVLLTVLAVLTRLLRRGTARADPDED